MENNTNTANVVTPEASTNGIISTADVTNTPQADVNNTLPADVTNTPDKPDYVLPEKFKTVTDLVKSYTELETKLGGSFGAPEEYKFNGDGAEPDGVKLFKQVAKENNLSQDAFDKIVNSYLSKESEIVKSIQENIEKTKTEIGKERITILRNKIHNLGLSQEQNAIIQSVVKTKAEFEAFEQMFNKINQSVTTVSNITAAIDYDKELNDIYTSVEWRTNPAKFHQRVLELTKAKLSKGT